MIDPEGQRPSHLHARINIYIYIYIYTYVHLFIYLHTCVYICTHIHIHTDISMYLHMHAYTNMCMYSAEELDRRDLRPASQHGFEARTALQQFPRRELNSGLSIDMYVCICVYVYRCQCMTYIYTHTYMYIYAYPHSYVRVYAHVNRAPCQDLHGYSEVSKEGICGWLECYKGPACQIFSF